MEAEELEQLKGVVSQAAEEIEGRLAVSLNKAIEGLDAKISSAAATGEALKSTATTALEALPNLIQEKIEAQLKDNLQGIVEEVGNRFEERLKAGAGAGAGAGKNGGPGLDFNALLGNSDKIIGVINAFRSPTTEQAMMGQMNFVMKWHQLLSKMEKGGGSGDDLTSAIAETFTTQANK